MIEADNKFSPPTSTEPEKVKHSVRRKILVFAIFFILVAGALAVLYWLPMHRHIVPMLATADTVDAAQKIAALEYKVEAIDARLTDLASRVDVIAAAPAASSSADPSKGSKISTADLGHMQGDLAALAATVSGLQAEVAAARAESIAFMQLRDAAMSGHGFGHELEVLQGAARNDPDLKSLLDKLKPFTEGAPTGTALREQLTEQSGAIDQAIAKTEAQNWWERVLAELKRLVSIRRLHGSASADASLDAMQEALARDNFDKALDEFKSLPPEAQKTLDDWRQQVEARCSINQAMQALVDHLVAGANITPAARDTP